MKRAFLASSIGLGLGACSVIALSACGAAGGDDNASVAIRENLPPSNTEPGQLPLVEPRRYRARIGASGHAPRRGLARRPRGNGTRGRSWKTSSKHRLRVGQVNSLVSPGQHRRADRYWRDRVPAARIAWYRLSLDDLIESKGEVDRLVSLIEERSSLW